EQLRLLREGAELVGGDPERAVRLNQEILRLDAGDARARRALEELYEKTGRLADLARILEQSLGREPAPQAPERSSDAEDGGVGGKRPRPFPEADEALSIRLRLL